VASNDDQSGIAATAAAAAVTMMFEAPEATALSTAAVVGSVLSDNHGNDRRTADHVQAPGATAAGTSCHADYVDSRRPEAQESARGRQQQTTVE